MDYVTRQFIFLAKKFRKELHKAQESLHHDLMRLSDRLKNLTDATNTQQQADNKGENAFPVTVSEFRTQVPIRIEKNAKKSKPEWAWAIIKGTFEIAVAIAVLGYTIISYQNWQEEIDATNFAGRQTELSRKGLNENIKNFQLDERPWANIGRAGIPIFSTNSLVTIPFRIEVSGKTPAKNVRGIVFVTPLSIGEKLNLSENGKGFVKIGTNVLFPGIPLNFNASMSNGEGKEIVLDEPLHSGFRNGGTVLILHGNVTYEDVFRPSIYHWMRFCEIMSDTPNRALLHAFNSAEKDCIAYSDTSEK